MIGDVELVLDTKATLGEGPVWDQKTGALFWVDIEGEKIYIYYPETGEDRILDVGQRIGAIVPRQSGGAVAALENGLYFVDIELGQFEFIVNPEGGLPENRFNDGKCDPKGRFWAGTLNMSGKEGQASLYCLETDGSLTKKLDGLSISNGLAWSPDHKFMYFIDTPTRNVVRFEYNLETGDIRNPDICVTIPDGEGFPDGMTIDSEGHLWIAHWGGGKVSRWNPATGIKVTEIEIPAVNVTSCTFGGEHLLDLYVTTARDGMSDEELEKYPNAGGVFKVTTATKGLPGFQYMG
ncbi:SMP-30/gluconolaconase/LRE domain protein [Bacillus sp. FJAT-27225]|uniref:SMP-30/gluconolactonase/LRE family protein n=1 Tax=Bacillus sp. FJAT-27225 TaxID=1743144 RepID=UPI00080C20D8|nr:SMP-30/gluconolactonase/LRE family protein [Bacillus sp. FJAT-27225]OCA81565.1 SMP-30/gluconolaconase/LRE domain protein [Bacillus sp. FJAT-27225]